MALHKSLIDQVNENTKSCTDFYDFAEPYKVFRRLKIHGKVELEEVSFYSGYKNVGLQIIPREYSSKMDEYEPNSSFSEWHLQQQRESSLRIGTELNAVFQNFTSGHICFTGPAGIGKTTLMKLIARETLDKKYEALKEIELVIFLQCKQFRPDRQVTVEEFLFLSAGVSDEDWNTLAEFAKACPNKILFVLDSLDTLPYTVDGVYNYINSGESACPEAILFNFLSGRILPGCRIITSSREHSILNYKGEIRPRKVIALRGFSRETIKLVIEGYVGDEADQLFRRLENEMPNILALCSTPVTLVYTLIGLRAKSDLKPTSTTAILSIVLQSNIRSQHMHLTREEVIDMLLKLEELSHIGNMKGVVYFTREYFDQVSLQPEKAIDLAVMTPVGITQKLLQGNSILFFSHQTFQEMLGALWVAGSSEEFFKNFLEVVNLPRFAVIRRYLYGTMLDRRVHEAICDDLLPDDDHYEAKVELLKENIRSQLLGGITLAPMLELFISMNEAQDGIDEIIKSSIESIDMQGIPLSATDMFCIGSMASKFEQLACVNFRHCFLESSLIEIFYNTVRGSTLQILRLHFGGNPNLGLEGMAIVGRIAQCCNSEEFDMGDCNLSGDQMQVLADVKIKKLSVLNLSWNMTLGMSGMEGAGKMVTRWNVEDLQLRGCKLSGKQLQVLATSISAANSLRKLRLGGNRNLKNEGVSAAGEIVSKCCLEELDLSGCNLSSDQIYTLAKSTEHAEKLRVLNLTDKKEATREDIESLANLLRIVKDSIQLEWWKISEQNIRYLQTMLNAMGETALTVVLSGKEMKWQAVGLPIMPGSLDYVDESFSTSMDQIIREDISRPVSTSKIIGSRGGAVRLRGCMAGIPEDTIDENVIVTLTARTKDTDIPTNYQAISPELQCSTSSDVKFRRLVTIKLPLYRRDVEDKVIILCKTRLREEWKELETECFENDGSLSFKVSHFSWLTAVWKKIFGSKTTVVNFLYYKPSNAQIYGLTCIAEEGIIASSTGSLEKNGYTNHIEVPDKVLLENGERIGYSLILSSLPGHRIEPASAVHTEQEISESQSLSQKFIITPMPSASSDITVQYTLEKPNRPKQPSHLRLSQFRDNTVQHEMPDATASVLGEDVICSTEDAYKNHLDNVNTYQILSDRQKGAVLIINNDFQGTREGSDKDVENMQKLWRSLGFKVETKLNLSDGEMNDASKNFARESLNLSAVIVIIMSHGGKEDGKEYFLGNNGGKILVCDLIDIFSARGSPHLDGIPKVFLFQACRGKKGEYRWDDTQEDASPERQQPKSPNRADILISFPTQSGYKALRERSTGSWLMNAISNVFTQNAHDTNVQDMLTMVNREVGNKVTDTRRVQISNQESYFRKRLFLFPGWPKQHI